MVELPFAQSGDLEVRRLARADAHAVLDVYCQCEDFLALGPEARASMTMVRADMETSRRENGVFCGIYKRGRMIGIADFIPNGFDGRSDAGFISLLMIARPFRGQGSGSEVAGLIERQVQRDYEVTCMRTAVQVNNLAAVRFWQNRGYKIIAGPESQPDGTTVFHLEKELSREKRKR